MRKRRFLVLSGSILLVLTLAVLPVMLACAPKEVAPPPPAEEEKPPPKVITLSLATGWPATHFYNTEILPQWIEDVEKATNGRVKIDLYSGGTLLKCGTVYTGVVEGTADIGNDGFGYTPGRFPLMGTIELPAITLNTCQVCANVAWDFYKEFNPEELRDVKVLWLSSTGPGVLLTKTPVRNLTDLQGMRVRATGLNVDTLKALGADPVAMPTPETYISLEKGIISAYLGPPESLKSMKFADLLHYMTVTPFIYNFVFFTVMNLETWNSLPEDIKKAFDGVSAEYLKKDADIWQSWVMKGIDYAKGTEEGLEVVYLSAEETAKWESLIEPVQRKYVDDLEAKGLPGKAALDFIIKSAEKYNKMYPITEFLR